MRKVKRKKLHGIWFSIFAFVCKYNIFLDHLIDCLNTIDIASPRAAAETTEEIANNYYGLTRCYCYKSLYGVCKHIIQYL